MSERRALDDAIVAQRRSRMVAGLRGLARPDASGMTPGGGVSAAGGAVRTAPRASELSEHAASAAGEPPTTADAAERCDLCGTSVLDDHRHLLHLVERQIVCVCEACWALRAGDPELRPAGSRTVWLDDFRLPDELWASFGIPIGLAFFLHSSVTNCVVALYPSPAGATESELRFDAWDRLRTLNPVLDGLEPDGEGLIVNRMADPPTFAIAPIDRCYLLVGLIKASWQGISGGSEVEQAVQAFFAQLRERAVAA
jgi:hypothetical protein